MKKLLLAVAFVSLSIPATAGELEEAVAKLIIDVHNLKQKVIQLQTEVERLKSSKNKVKEDALKQEENNCVREIRGEFIRTPKNKYCLLATVKRPSKKGERYVLSRIPKEAPLYLKKSKDGKYYVYFTLPEYCKEVKDEIPDAYTWSITLSCPEQ